MVNVIFEKFDGSLPTHTEGPFVWVEMIYGIMFGLRPTDKEATEIAGFNCDNGTWDVGPAKRPHGYDRWLID